MDTATDDGAELIRQQSFDCEGPVDIDIELGNGSIELRLNDSTARPNDLAARPSEPGEPEDSAGPAESDTPRPAVVVEVRHEPGGRAEWGLSGLLNWVGDQFGATASLAEHAVRETTIALHGNRLTVRGPRSMPLRTVSLSVTVHAPAGSDLEARCGSADIRVSGPAGRVDIDNGSGDISVDQASYVVQVKTGSGAVRLGQMLNGLTARSGSGDLEVLSLSGSGTLQSGSGDIWLGTVRGDKVNVRTGSGDLTVADAAEGQLTLVTGSGDLRVGIHKGVCAEVDVVSGAGRVRSDLPVSSEPPSDEEAPLAVRARTGSGEAVVTAATA